MHPLVARLHPSLRTAFFAWLIARVAVWAGSNVRLGRVFPDLSVAIGTPAYQALRSSAGLIPDGWGPLSLAVASELLLLFGVVALYRFARRDGVPQTADRATWLWIACPAMLFAPAGSDWAFAYALVALAFGNVSHIAASSLLLATAVAFRPEAVLVWPGIAWIWWTLRSDSDPLVAAVVGTLAPLAFAATVLGGILVSDPNTMLAGGFQLRQDLSWHGWENHLGDCFVGALLLGALLVAARMARETPPAWLLVTLPVLALAAVALPPLSGLAMIPLAIPLFVQLAKLAQDPNFERALLASGIVALAFGTPSCFHAAV